VLLPAPAGAQETPCLAVVPCQGSILTAKRGLKAPFVAKFGVHLGKESHVKKGVVNWLKMRKFSNQASKVFSQKLRPTKAVENALFTKKLFS